MDLTILKVAFVGFIAYIKFWRVMCVSSSESLKVEWEEIDFYVTIFKWNKVNCAFRDVKRGQRRILQNVLGVQFCI